MLSAAALETLQAIKCKLLARKHGEGLGALSVTEIAQLGELERRQDAKKHAEWAAGCVAERYDSSTILQADLWVKKKLRSGYLVQPEWIEYAYQATLRLARAR